MSRFMNSGYCELEEYVPGEQPTDMQYIKLNTNESPFSPSPVVEEAISKSEINKLNLYPDPECGTLTERLAKTYGFEKENIFIGNGSDEILSLAFMAFCENGVAYADITYGFYEVYARLNHVNAKILPLKEDFSLQPDDYMGINRAIFIANPNAPTGRAITVKEIEKIVKSNLDNVVVIDEAYVDFGGESAISLVREYDNILIVRTYSKSRSFAGGRLGFSIGSKEITADLRKLKYSTNPYNISRLSLTAAEACLDDENYYKDNCKKIIANREFTTHRLTEMGFEVLPSSTNFIFTRCGKISGMELYTKLKENGILVRHFTKERIKDYVRVTIGTEEQMVAFLSEVRYILEREGKLK
ncbi:histidinol-phosphate aminotransferase [Clostridiales bacterium]|nr:histidinol-phosphate aminotransferase [Clostridiales bacterium]